MTGGNTEPAKRNGCLYVTCPCGLSLFDMFKLFDSCHVTHVNPFPGGTFDGVEVDGSGKECHYVKISVTKPFRVSWLL